MPALPTFDITPEQAERCLAAWGSPINYKAWLRAEVVAYVRAAERAAAMADSLAAQQAALAAIDAVDPLDGAT